MSTFLAGIRADILDWCKGRSWLPRLLLLLWLGYVGVRQFLAPEYAAQCLFGAINLGIHEAGHLLTRGLGQFLSSAGGSFLQCLAPIISAFVFLRQRDYFGIAVSFGWLATNLVQVGVYMSDAQQMALPLVTIGDTGGDIEQLHDWHYLFGELGLLSSSEAIGSVTRALGHLSMLICLAGGAWLVRQISALRGRTTEF